LIIILKRSVWLKFSITLCLFSLIFTPITYALDGKFDEGFYSSNDILFYNPEATSCAATSSAGSSTGSDKATSGSWSSGLTAPFIMEQFAIETLKDVAAKKGVDPTDAVTQEHVIALVAFMFGEGGDINNQDLFNPLNTGIDAPDLIDGSHRGDGVQSFKSFDAGVEATARTIVGSNQSRLGNVLTQKDSTAQQFMSALTYFSKYPGNAFWAAASLPPNQDSYYHARLGLIQQIRSNYADSAGLILGTPQKEQLLNLTNKAKLTFHPTTDTSSSADSATAVAGSSGCPADSGVMSGSIIETALKLAWPTKHDPPLTPTPAYVEAMNKYNPGALSRNGGADCGAFVGTVMRTSGVDKNYPEASTGAQLDYAKQHPEKYSVLAAITSTADMQPGDILVTSHHTFIFVGNQSNGNDQASASQGERMPNLGKATITDTTGTAYSRVRVIK